jgi:hypothetical protein
MFGSLKSKVAGMAGGAVEKHLPAIQALVEEHVGPKLREVAQDEEKLKGAFKGVYMVVPLPIKLVLSEDKFVQLCMDNRQKFIPADAAFTT